MIAGAKVTAANVATDISTSVTSSLDGSYQFLELAAPAIYNVKAEEAGFKVFAAQFNALKVNVNSNSRNFGRDLSARPPGIDSRIIQLAAKINF